MIQNSMLWNIYRSCHTVYPEIWNEKPIRSGQWKITMDINENIKNFVGIFTSAIEDVNRQEKALRIAESKK